MDKNEYNLKLDELRELFQQENYREAAEVADQINWKKVRNTRTLCMVADVYEAVERYGVCQEVLLQAYDHSSSGRNIVSRLTDVAIKSKDIPTAEEYYSEFLELAPKDTQRYVFAYKIACLKNAPLADRIAILEELKEKEYSEMWAYELAVLYAQAGMREKCVETCDELILWFGDGEYVERALDLKRSFQPLTAAQEEKYRKLCSREDAAETDIPQKPETAAASDTEIDDSDEILPEAAVTATRFDTQNLQDVIAADKQQIMDSAEEAEAQVQEEVFIQDTDEMSMEDILDDTDEMSIEDILADWEKTKAVVQRAMAAAEQRKLDLEKEQALAEASAIMGRLEELVPIFSDAPGEDLPNGSEDTAADGLLSPEPWDAAGETVEAIAEEEIPEVDVEAIAEALEADAEAEAEAECREKEFEASSVTLESAAEEDIEAAVAAAWAEMDSTATSTAGTVNKQMNTGGDFEQAGSADASFGSPEGIEALSEEIRRLFSYFIPIPGMPEQIARTLADTAAIKSSAVTSSTGNVIIQGEEGSGKTMLATDLIRAVQKVIGREDDKIGKISAGALDKRDFAELLPKIGGGYLIVEKAGDLSGETAAAMSKAMEGNTNGMTVILEDDSSGIHRVLSLDPYFASKFTEMLRIPIFTIDELVDFGKSYALEQECEIEETAVLALHNRINGIQKSDRPTTLTAVKKIVDEAIENAESGGIKKLFAKKYNDDDFLILHEEDFQLQ